MIGKDFLRAAAGAVMLGSMFAPPIVRSRPEDSEVYDEPDPVAKKRKAQRKARKITRKHKK